MKGVLLGYGPCDLFCFSSCRERPLRERGGDRAKWNEVVPAPISPGKNSLVCTSLERVGHVVDSDDDPGPDTPCVWSLGLALAHNDVPGCGTPLVSSLALAFADAMGRCSDVLVAANPPAAGVSDQHGERTAVCLSATHGRVAHSF
jgi:hypothetical protein